MFRSRSWFGGGLWKPKNPHSLEHLKYLYNVLSKNQTVSETNRSLLVETLRSIAEILIWGDQNDSTVFDFFLEKNMLSFFLKIMKQKCGSYVCVQLLQTLNILFENIRNETSLYYLLSNNHVNSIIVHKFDFSDEEVMAYYISFLKTLSLKLNSHTIHFFYNEHTHDFPLYTEAIKFFNNGESMVRIAVRTLTLNVYRVRDKSMLKFIRDKTAAPYFSNLVWFIGNHVLELNSCILDNADHEARPRLADLVAEHLDHLHYLNDILCLRIDDLNQVLTEHLLHRLFVPLYITSLDRGLAASSVKTPLTPRVSRILALFLLSQVFLIMTHSPLVRVLASIILNGNETIFEFQPEVFCPAIPLTATKAEVEARTDCPSVEENSSPLRTPSPKDKDKETENIPASPADSLLDTSRNIIESFRNIEPFDPDLSRRPFLASVFESLDLVENDYAALFSLGLLQALYDNSGIDPELINAFFRADGAPVQASSEESEANCSKYNIQLADKLISIIGFTVKYESKVRVVTLQLVISLLLKTVTNEDGTSCLGDPHLAAIEGAREENILILQNYFKSDEMFLEVFEDEYLEMTAAKVMSIEHLMMDSNLLLPPVGSPLTGISFDKRLPCGEVERSRRSMRVYFLLRKLSLALRNESETYLPLTNTQTCVHIEENLDLTNSDMLACTVITRENIKTRRFLVIDVFQLILVEPSHKQMGWGVAKFVGFLQDIEVLGDKDDSRCLHITVKSSPTSQRGSQCKTPLLSAKFLFDDHIRCMAAKQRLVKGKQKARQRKLHMIAKMLDLTGTSPSPPQILRKPNRRPLTRSERPLFNHTSKTLPGSAIAVVTKQPSSNSTSNSEQKSRNRKSRESSPSVMRLHEEEIPLGNIRTGRGHLHLSRNTGGSSQSTSSSPPVNHPIGLGLNLTVNASENSTVKPRGTPEVINSRVEGDAAVTTPQSETSFMTVASTSVNRSPNLYNNTNSNNFNQGVKKKKGAVETV